MIDKEQIRAWMKSIPREKWYFSEWEAFYSNNAVHVSFKILWNTLDSLEQVQIAKFLANSPLIVENLLSEVERLEGELAKFKECKVIFGRMGGS